MLLALSGVVTTSLVCAQPRASLDLQWEAPAGCPQRSEVRAAVQKLAGEKIAGVPVQADGKITQTEDGRFHLRLVVRSGGLLGERNIESKSCEDLAGAAAVALGLSLRSAEPLDERAEGEPPANSSSAASGEASTSTSPSSGGVAKHPEPDSSQAPAEAEAITETPSDRTTGDAPSSRSFRGLVQAPLFALSIGPLPQVGLGLGLAGGAAFQKWRFLLEGEKWLVQSVPAEGFPQYGADVDRSTATLRGCHAFELHPGFEVAPCLVLSVEHISAHGTGQNIVSQSQNATWLAPGAGAQGLLSVTRWFNLVIAVDGRIEASRPQIVIEGIGNVAQLGPAAFTVTIGSEWIL